MIKFHYAYQICDLDARDPKIKRFCGDDRTLLSKKCITSFYQSLEHLLAKHPDTEHYIMMLCDNSSDDLYQFVNKIQEKYSRNNVSISVTRSSLGCKESMRTCFDWLADNGEQFVYLVQDDYLYIQSALYEMASIFFQLNSEHEASQPIVLSFNYPKLWSETYKGRPTPRAIFMGEKRYWLQTYDTPSTFLTSKIQLSRNWDLINYFLKLDFQDQDLEAKSLNKMFTKKGILGVLPINSVAFHMQGNQEFDPYVNLKMLFDSIEVEHETPVFDLPEGNVVLNVGGGGITCKNSIASEGLSEYNEVFVDLDDKSNPHILSSMMDLSMIKSDSVDCVYSSHSLEHIHFHEIPKCLSEWHRVIKDTGEVRIVVPNLKVPAQMAAEGKLLDVVYESPVGPITSLDMFYGHRGLVQKNEYMAHKTGFIKESIEQILDSLNYKNYNVAEEGFNLVIRIRK